MEINVNELTVCQVKEISRLFKNQYDGDLIVGSISETLDTGPWEIGKKYFIRTVTMNLTGELISVSPQELVLKDAAWIADSGRFNEALKDISKCDEVEPFINPAIIGRGSIIDATVISNITTSVK